MKMPDFFKSRAAVFAEFQSMMSETPPPELKVLYEFCSGILEGYEQHETQQSSEGGAQDVDLVGNQTTSPDKSNGDAVDTGGETEVTEAQQASSGNSERYYYFHVTSKCHIDAHILARPEVKQIFERECLHYGRVCEIAITNYCIMDNHFHLKVGVPATSLKEARHKLSKMMGSIKQQFTRRFKLWYNVEYRRENKHRKPKIGNGTMWAGRIHVEYIKDEAQLVACALYVEANRIKISCAEDIAALNEPPQTTNDLASEHFGLQPAYGKILTTLYDNKAQSARFYLSDSDIPPSNTALTDGKDGHWASEEEVSTYWNLPASSLPTDWRKVYHGGERRILKPTCLDKRTYHTTSFIQRLGRTPAIRRRNFARLVLSTCWKSRANAIAFNSNDSQTQPPVPGVSF